MYPVHGDVWMINLNPTKGREQKGIHPALIISVDGFNNSAADLIIAIPITSKMRGIPLHVQLEADECGLKVESFARCENIRSVSKERLIEKLGKVPINKIEEIERKLKLLLGL